MVCRKVRVNRINPDKLGGRCSPIFHMATDRIHVLPIALGVASAGPFSGASWDQEKVRAEVVSDRRLNFLGVK